MDYKICKAEYEDLQDILQLQYMAFKRVAELFINKKIEPLTQTLDELTNEYENGIVLKMIDKDNVIIGSVRAREKNGTAYIGKLIVHPEHQGRGYGSMLLNAIEKYYRNCRYELFTSSNSIQNIQFYQKNGYRIFTRKKINDELEFVYMEKGFCSKQD